MTDGGRIEAFLPHQHWLQSYPANRHLLREQAVALPLQGAASSQVDEGAQHKGHAATHTSRFHITHLADDPEERQVGWDDVRGPVPQ